MILQRSSSISSPASASPRRSWSSPRSNPVHSVLFLILAFVNAAGLFVLMGAEFLAMILIVVYVGAVAVLFLFVVMMLDVDFAELRQGLLQLSADRRRWSASFCSPNWCSSWSAPGSFSPACRRRSPRRSRPPARQQHGGARARALHALCLFLPGRRHHSAGRHDRRHRADAAAQAAASSGRTSPSRSRAGARPRSRSSR